MHSSLHNLKASAVRVRLPHLLLMAAVIHLLLVILLNAIGRLRLLPSVFDENGIGISFAADSTGYRSNAVALARVLELDGISAWITRGAPFHLRLYSICYATLGHLFGYTTLSAEPLNLAYYLLILVLVFMLGREVFDRRVGLLAAGVVAVWPSFLLHTTQLLRDPLFIVAMLTLLLVGALLLNRERSRRCGLSLAFMGGVAAIIVWLTRSQMWEVMIASITLTFCLLLAKQFRRRSFEARSLASCCLLLLIVLGLPPLGRRLNLYSYPPNQAMVVDNGEGKSEVVYMRRLPPGSSLPARISYLRRAFVMAYPLAGSNIDSDVEFKSAPEIILYLPRAAEIGFFAPFPKMWLVPGMQVGLIGRLWSGFETLLMYGIELLAVACLCSYRRHPGAWLLFIYASVGMLALGLVVANVAALYRMRYAFCMLFVTLGIKGALIVFHQAPKKGTRRGGSEEDQPLNFRPSSLP